MTLYTVDTLPTSSAAAVRDFSDRFIAAQGTFAPLKWFDVLGLFESTNTPITTYMISQLALLYLETKGENRFKEALERSFDVKSVEFDEGISAKLLDLYTQTFSVRRWQQGPQLLTIAEEKFRGKNVAALLEAGVSTACYDGENFFSDSHPVNLGDASLGTYDNYQAAATDVVSVANIEAELDLFRQNCKDENGDRMDPNSFAIGVPTAKYEKLRNLLKREQIANTAGTASETNPYAGDGGVEVVHMPQLANEQDWYIFAKDLIQVCPPWLTLKLNVPGSLALRNYDESTDYFRDTGKIKVSSHIWYGFALGFPQSARFVTGA